MTHPAGLETATSVVAWFFGSERDAYRAIVALQDIEHGRGLRSVGVLDATVVTRKSAATLCFDRTVDFRGRGPGGQLGLLFPPSILAHRAIGPTDSTVADHFSALGMRAGLLRELGENLEIEGAAVVVLLNESWIEELGDVMSGSTDIERWALEVEART